MSKRNASAPGAAMSGKEWLEWPAAMKRSYVWGVIDTLSNTPGVSRPVNERRSNATSLFQVSQLPGQRHHLRSAICDSRKIHRGPPCATAGRHGQHYLSQRSIMPAPISGQIRRSLRLRTRQLNDFAPQRIVLAYLLVELRRRARRGVHAERLQALQHVR